MLVFPIHGQEYHFDSNGNCCYPEIVLIPNSVKQLTSSIRGFQNHTEVKEICFEDDSTITNIPSSCFRGMSSVQNIYNLPKSLTNIDYYAFEDCHSLETIILPTSITKIPDNCFKNCHSLERIEAPGVTILGNNAFAYCSSLNEDFVMDLLNNRSLTVYSGVFTHCDNLFNLTIKLLWTQMFEYCNYLKMVNITGSSGSTGTSALANCKNLETVIFEDTSKITTFGGRLFENDISLKTIQLPTTLTTIEGYCFAYCHSLPELVLSHNVTSIGSSAFRETKNLKNFIWPNSVLTINSEMFREGGLQEIVIEEGITSIGNYAFYSCKNLSKITFPENSLKTINYNAFAYCDSLTDITIPDSVTTLGSYLFSNCKALKNVNLPAALTVLDNYVFASCNSLHEIIIPENVTTIKNYCIQNSGLQRIYLGSKISTIESSAFSSANSLTDIYFNKIKGTLTVPTNKWGATNATIHWLTSTTHFTSNADLSRTKIFIEENEVENLEYKTETVGEVDFKAYNPDFLPLIGTFNSNPPNEHVLDLQFNNISESGIQGVVLTILPEIENCIINLSIDNVILQSDYITVLPGTEVTYWVETPEHKFVTGTVIVNETTNLSIPEDVFTSSIEDVKIVYPFDDEINTKFISNLVDGNNFIIDSTTQSIQSGPKSYNVNSGTSYGYIEIKTPPLKQTFSLSISAFAQGENNYDFGFIYLGTAIYKPTQAQVKNSTTDGKGKYLLRHTSTTYNDYVTVTDTLEPNTTYYLNFGFVKDGGGNTGIDRLRIKEINFTAMIEEKGGKINET